MGGDESVWVLGDYIAIVKKGGGTCLAKGSIVIFGASSFTTLIPTSFSLRFTSVRVNRFEKWTWFLAS